MNQEHSNQFHTDTLSCGLRIISAPSNSNVVYCGIAIDAGTRDELPDENGLAHFCEHLTFKGTQRRSSRQVINQMECVGGILRLGNFHFLYGILGISVCYTRHYLGKNLPI